MSPKPSDTIGLPEELFPAYNRSPQIASQINPEADTDDTDNEGAEDEGKEER